MNCSSEFIHKLSNFSFLHDIGKLMIPHKLLYKKEKITYGEFERIKKHVIYGHKIIKIFNLDEFIGNIVLYHHENFDGTGYPMGLKGKNIPLEARIVALADMYDALRENRKYKKSYSHEQTLEIIQKEMNIKLDPKIVEIFFKHAEEFKNIYNNTIDAHEFIKNQ